MAEMLKKLDPWMEQEAFDAIVASCRSNVKSNLNNNHNNNNNNHSSLTAGIASRVSPFQQPQPEKTKTTTPQAQAQARRKKTRFVQVVEKRTASQVLVVSDRHAFMTCSCPFDDRTIAKGAICKLQSYAIVPVPVSVGTCAATPETRTARTAATTTPSSSRSLVSWQLQTDIPVELVGASDMGIVGDPMDIHQTVQVRRALLLVPSSSSSSLTTPNTTTTPTTAPSTTTETTTPPKKSKSNSSHLGNALALLRNTTKLAQIMGWSAGGDDHDDDDENDEHEHAEEEEQERNGHTASSVAFDREEPMSLPLDSSLHQQQQQTPPPPRTMNIRNGDAMALLENEEKLQRVLGLHHLHEDAHDDDDNDDDDSNDNDDEYLETQQAPMNMEPFIPHAATTTTVAATAPTALLKPTTRPSNNDNNNNHHGKLFHRMSHSMGISDDEGDEEQPDTQAPVSRSVFDDRKDSDDIHEQHHTKDKNDDNTIINDDDNNSSNNNNNNMMMRSMPSTNMMMAKNDHDDVMINDTSDYHLPLKDDHIMNESTQSWTTPAVAHNSRFQNYMNQQRPVPTTATTVTTKTVSTRHVNTDDDNDEPIACILGVANIASQTKREGNTDDCHSEQSSVTSEPIIGISDMLMPCSQQGQQEQEQLYAVEQVRDSSPLNLTPTTASLPPTSNTTTDENAAFRAVVDPMEADDILPCPSSSSSRKRRHANLTPFLSGKSMRTQSRSSPPPAATHISTKRASSSSKSQLLASRQRPAFLSTSSSREISSSTEVMENLTSIHGNGVVVVGLSSSSSSSSPFPPSQQQQQQQRSTLPLLFNNTATATSAVRTTPTTTTTSTTTATNNSVVVADTHRFRQSRNFFKSLWNQRHERVIRFR